jgi:hypothetical protein
VPILDPLRIWDSPFIFCHDLPLTRSTPLTGEQIRAIADAIGDTEDGLTGSEIAHLLAACQITDTDWAATRQPALLARASSAIRNDPALDSLTHHATS